MELKDYSDDIALFTEFSRPPLLSAAAEKQQVLSRVLEFFISENRAATQLRAEIGDDRNLLRALLNIRPPGHIPPDIIGLLDRLLWTERVQAGIVSSASLKTLKDQFDNTGPHADRLCLWQGDITELDADAIVNAANRDLLGCFAPLHACIDNVIHSASGPLLREDCALIMNRQKVKEATGKAKITRAYNLPSRFVLHTVGPIVQGPLSASHRELLASSYRACLDLALETSQRLPGNCRQLESVAFCCISTGVFGFPAEPAARIAYDSVNLWLDQHPGTVKKVIFNVFSKKDYDYYSRICTE